MIFNATQIRTLRAARDACVAAKPMQEFGRKLTAVAPEFEDKLKELDAVTDYLETLVGVALAAVGE